MRNSYAKCVEALLALALLVGGCASEPPTPPPEEMQAVAGAPVEPVVAAVPPVAQMDEESLRREAMSDPSVQALFDIFPVEKSKVEEM